MTALLPSLRTLAVMPFSETVTLPPLSRALASSPVTAILPEKGSSRLERTSSPPSPAYAWKDAAIAMEAAISLICMFFFKMYPLIGWRLNTVWTRTAS